MKCLGVPLRGKTRPVWSEIKADGLITKAVRCARHGERTERADCTPITSKMSPRKGPKQDRTRQGKIKKKKGKIKIK